MRRAALGLGRVAALRYVGTVVLAMAGLGCSVRACGPSNAQLAEVARQQVCLCAELGGGACGQLATKTVRFSAGAAIFCAGTTSPGCYSPERGIEIATLDAHEGDIASGWRGEHQPWTHTSPYELLHRLRHEYLHAAGYGHGDALMDCEWEQ
jgi:hypothetical protein